MRTVLSLQKLVGPFFPQNILKILPLRLDIANLEGVALFLLGKPNERPDALQRNAKDRTLNFVDDK